MDAQARQILDFWLEEIGEKGWYEPPEGLDDTIRARFAPVWEAARTGAFDHWRTAPEGALALVTLFDQFPRNMFRGTARAFASDGLALAVAKSAIARGHDKRIDAPARQFFYMPLEHSETINDQDRSVRLVFINLGRGETLRHAQAHRAVIRRFGRFPSRNEPLGRRTTGEEAAWLEQGGYQAAFDAIGA